MTVDTIEERNRQRRERGEETVGMKACREWEEMNQFKKSLKAKRRPLDT